MSIFDPVTVGSLLILAASSPQQQNPCAAPKPTEINVIPSARETKWDYSNTLAQVQGAVMDTVNPYGFTGTTITEGYMKGSIKLEPKVKLNYKSLPRYNAVCLWYERIDINIELDPTIVIPKEVYKDRCMRKAVSEHELKHVGIDRKIVNKYSKIMGRKVYEEIGKRGFSAGPLPAEQAQAAADQMQRVVFQIVEQEYKRMDLERTDLQRGLDSLEEYDRVSGQCPDFDPLKAQKRR